ncbi:MAG: acyl-CoA dehydrogenase [Clostridia bacterium]|nr:acyl-CoA dehydrogenase [Clostridia bacterium]
MDFVLSKEHEMLRKMYREFAENEVKPLAQEIDEEERFPMETVKKMARLGMMGTYFPREYGGAGADPLAYVMCVEELAKVCGTTAVIVSAHTSLCAAPIFENGTEEQKMKYLPKLCSGEWIGAFGLTEPGAGTDAQGQQTTAVLEGDHYVLNGSKCFITNGNVADVFIIIAVTGTATDKRGRKVKEISAFIVERTFPGFSQGKHEKKMGIRGSSTCDLIFEDCIVPKENLLGKVGDGFKIAMKTLDGGRIGIAAQALGLGEGAVEEAIKYTRERVQFGKRISQFQNTQFQLADMHTRMQAAQYLVYAAAMKKEEHARNSKVSYSMDAAMAKLFAAEAASDVTRRAVQLFGGYGYTREYPVERMMRDAKITEIYEGTSEVQKMVIASNLGVK